MTPAEWELLSSARDALAAAPHGTKDEVASRAATALGCSVKTLYRRLGTAGFESGRKQRRDAGRSAVSHGEAKLAAGVLLASTNQKGQHMPLVTAVEMLRANGRFMAGVSAGTLARQLRANGLHPKQLALPSASIELGSEHPGHVSQCDSTTGAYYYLPGGRLRWMPEDEFYKNKVANLVRASSDLLTRYAYADHTSHAFKCRYYLGGETAENLLDFLTWAMWKQDDSPVHGVPRILMMDPGAANKSLLMRNFCRRIDLQLIHHAPGAARVTGSVEKVHDLVRMHFETRLRFFDPREVTLDRLNAQISAWVAGYCATHIHKRTRKTRYGKWMEIRADLGQLRVAASLEALRESAQREPETRRVSNDLKISFGRPARYYRVDMVPGVHAAGKVTVVQNVFRAPAIDVLVIDTETGEETWQIVEPIETDEHGFSTDAVMIGHEMRRAGNSGLDDARNALTKQAYRTPGGELPTLDEAKKARKRHEQAYAGMIDALADVKASPVPAYLPRRGTALDAPVRTVVARVLGVVEACTRLRTKHGDEYPREIYAWLDEHFAQGVAEDQVDAVFEQFKSGGRWGEPAASEGTPLLHAVGGGQ